MYLLYEAPQGLHFLRYPRVAKLSEQDIQGIPQPSATVLAGQRVRLAYLHNVVPESGGASQGLG